MTGSRIFIAASGDGIHRAAPTPAGSWEVEKTLAGPRVNCLAADPFHPQRLIAGTQQEGMLISEDGGQTWQPAGLKGQMVKSLAISPHAPGTIYAGCKPVSLFVTHNNGETWEELPDIKHRRRWWWFSPAEPPDFNPYVQALTISPTDPQVMLAGIELGGVLRSTDGGQTWSKHCRGAVLDCHSLKFHSTDGSWVYEGGGSGSGAAFSRDGGVTWQQAEGRFAGKYGWMVAADPAQPEIWYLSASRQPNLLRGEFTPPAHHDGQAGAHIYRFNGGGKGEPLAGGLPQPLDDMAYALVTDPAKPGHLYAGLSNGQVWHTTDLGNTWEQLPFNLGRIHSGLLILSANRNDLTTMANKTLEVSDERF